MLFQVSKPYVVEKTTIFFNFYIKTKSLFVFYYPQAYKANT